MNIDIQEINDIFQIAKQYYNKLNGGIDGYYERVILESNHFKVSFEDKTCYYSVHETRGLTMFYCQFEDEELYTKLLSAIIQKNLFSNVLFSENDKVLYSTLNKLGFEIKIQAYNFDFLDKVDKTFPMRPISEDEYLNLNKPLRDFLDYNEIDLSDLIYVHKVDDIVSLGIIEPLTLNPQRSCIAMIVDEKYRKQGYGVKTIRFLVKVLQKRNHGVNARCFVENEISRKTLLKSGFTFTNHLYRIDDLKGNR